VYKQTLIVKQHVLVCMLEDSHTYYRMVHIQHAVEGVAHSRCMHTCACWSTVHLSRLAVLISDICSMCKLSLQIEIHCEQVVYIACV
jgi:hypothetical protein